MKRITLFLAVLFSVTLCSCQEVKANPTYGVVYHKGEEYTYKKNYSELLDEHRELSCRLEASHLMAESARALGYEENHSVIELAQEEWQIANKEKQEKEILISKLERTWENYWQTKEEEYSAATYIWKYFLELGYNEYVIAGIMGNLMAEVGGQTLNIQYWLYGNGYYGMCQWSKAYSEIWGKSLEDQCDFLRDTIEYEINTYGYKYEKGFDYEAFLALDNEKDAALAFATTYERCGSGSYSKRKSNATKALEYFLSE